MDPTTLWLIAGGVILIAFVAVGLIAVNRRRAIDRRQTLEIPDKPGADGRGAPAQDAGDSSTRVRDSAGDSPVLELEPGEIAEPTSPVIDRPEAPDTRLARLRRRLAGSNSALSRGLLLLITRDRIDEDTWDAFEEILITSDLGVGSTTELVTALRGQFRVEGIGDAAQARAILRAELVKLVDPTWIASCRPHEPSTRLW